MILFDISSQKAYAEGEGSGHMKDIYVITGANGHLGNVVVRKLIEQKKSIRALVLPNTPVDIITSPYVQIYEGDVRFIDTLEPLFARDEAVNRLIVIHTAGIVSIATRQTPLLRDVNVGGTMHMVDLAMRHHVDRFIYISSVHAIPEKQGDETIDEIELFDPNDVEGAYAKTKAEATQYVMEAIKKGLHGVILHPSGIIGPDDPGRSNMTMMIQDYLNHRLTSRVNGAYDFVDVRDVADAIIQATHLDVESGAYILSGHHVDLKVLFEMMRKAAGRKRHIHILPMWFAKMTIPLAELYYRLKRQSPIYSKYSLYTLRSNAHFANDKAKKHLNFQPRPLHTTVIDTICWLVEEKRVTHKKTVNYVKSMFKSNQKGHAH